MEYKLCAGPAFQYVGQLLRGDFFRFDIEKAIRTEQVDWDLAMNTWIA